MCVFWLSQKFDQSPSGSALQWYDICTRMNMNTSERVSEREREREEKKQRVWVATGDQIDITLNNVVHKLNDSATKYAACVYDHGA